MPWLQATYTTDPERAPLLEAALEGAGALAVTLSDAGDEPQLEPSPGTTPLWSQVEVTALFTDNGDSLQRAQELAATLAPWLASPPRFERLADRAWERVWLDEFAPARYGSRLWISPRGQVPAAEGAVVVELDPGLAFGTGHHPTTALCLEWLDAADLIEATVLDYGCGSGILAIAALRLGAARAIAVDHDPQALEATEQNARENGVDGRLLVCPPSDLPETGVEVLLANILAGPLIELAPRLSRLVRPAGRLVLSGILREQAGEVAAAYRDAFALDEPVCRDEWVLLAGRRNPPDSSTPEASESCR
jgi:ribosomal protein L11 methyltransferase